MLKEKIRSVLGARETPHRIALAFSVGVFIAFSPLLGLHTVLAVFLAWGFRLNKIALFLGAFLNNPWTFAPITLGSVWVGANICCDNVKPVRVLWESPTFQELKTHLAYPFILGSVLISLITSVLAYLVMYSVILQYRKVRSSDGAPLKDGTPGA